MAKDNWIRKCISMFLILAMVLQYIPLTALAVDGDVLPEHPEHEQSHFVESGAELQSDCTHPEMDENGFCDDCGGFQSAALNQEDYYEIGNAGQMFWFAELVNGGERDADAKLTADIDLEGREWTTICSTGLYFKVTDYPDLGYEGTFDGNGHVISDFVVKGISGQECTSGLFGTLSGTIRNLGVDNMTFELNDASDVRAAAIAGQMIDGSLVENCYVINSTLTPNQNIVGGVAGCNYAGTIRSCYTYNVKVAANERCGNLVSDIRGDISADDRPGTVINCWTDADRVVGTQTSSLVYDCRGSVASAYFADGTVVWYLNGQSADGIWKQNGRLPGFTGTTVTALPNTGSGEPAKVDGVYQIGTKDELCWFASYVNIVNADADAVLVADIDLGSGAWAPIGTVANPYTGTFDGQGHAITNLNASITAGSRWGLFGEISGCTIRDFSLDGDVTVDLPSEQTFYFAVAAGATNSTISDVHSSVDVTVLDSYIKNGIAGIAAVITTSTVVRCSYSGTIDMGNARLDCGGGIVAYGNYNNAHVIRDCGFYGTIKSDVTESSSGQIGGILGYYRGNNLTVENCLSVGTMEIGNPGHTGMIAGRIREQSSRMDWVARNYFLEGDVPAFSNDPNDSVDMGDYGADADNAEVVSAERMASGEIAYLLQGDKTEQVWGQKLGEDPYPVVFGEKVYAVYSCLDEIISYSNVERASAEHSYENGFCTVCGGYEAPELNADGFYEIGNAGQLYWFADQVNNGANNINAILTDKIEVNENLMEKITIAEDGTATVNEGETIREWVPIGGLDYHYSGTFDGNGKTVTGLYHNVSADYVGLIGYLEGSGKVQNVMVADSYFCGGDYVGGVVGRNNDSTVSNCHNTGTVSGDYYVGGVAGENGGSMTECCNAGTVSGSNIVGGVVGACYDGGTVSNCYNAGTVSGSKSSSSRYVGGVVGRNNGSTVSNCYNTGSVSGDNNVGGVVGYCNASCTVSNCHNTGTVRGSYYVGGVAGWHADGTLSNCYNTGTVRGDYNVGGVVGHNGGSVTECCNAGTVSGSNNVGGVVGRNNGSTVSNCYNTGSVSDGNNVGGVIGYCYAGSTVSNCYNTGSVSDGNNVGGVVGVNNGTVTNCFYLDTCGATGVGTAKTEAQFASGEVTYLLQIMQKEQIWGQKIGEEPYPVLYGEKVYAVYNCLDEIIYSNVERASGEHSYENGFCTFCGGYEVPELNAEGYYEIGNAGQLYWFADQVNNGANNINAILTADIEDNENLMEKITIAEDGTATVNEGETIREWVPIGGSKYYYSGTFDGNSKTVTGLYRNVSAKYVGLIGYLEGSGKVQNVTVADSYFCGGNYVGGVAGYNGGSMTECCNAGTVSGKYEVGGVAGWYVGGVAGYNGGSMTECCNAGTVSGSYYVGGVAGWLNDSTVSNCYNTGTVSGSYYVGGVVGRNEDGTVSNCYNTGTVSSDDYVGGVAGYCVAGGTVSNCYNTGSVSAGMFNGGVVGVNYGTVTNCYNTGSVSAGVCIGGVVGDNSGTVTNCFYLNTCGAAGYGTAKTEAKFASGEVAWLLNGSTDEGELVWGQKLGVDPYPVLYGDRVYLVIHCNGDILGYSNEYIPTPDHQFTEEGFCTVCGGFVEPKLNTDGFYEITKAGELYWFAEATNNHDIVMNAILMNDIVVNENLMDKIIIAEDGTATVKEGETVRRWTPIGDESFNFAHMCGIFDGNGKTISGLFHDNSSWSCVGLIGYVREGGVVQNVTVADSYFNGNSKVAGVVGHNRGTVRNCANISYIKGDTFVGGVVGQNWYASVQDCYTYGEIVGRWNVGGVVGVDSGEVINSYYLDTFTEPTAGAARSAEQFASGEVAYLLQGDKTEQVWGQKIGEEPYPVLYGEKVYPVRHCNGEILDYANEEIVTPEHQFAEEGFCTACGGYKEPKLNGDNFYEITNIGELYWFAAQVNKRQSNINAILMNDIVDNENLMDKLIIAEDGTATVREGETVRSWIIIGGESNSFTYLNGCFDGNGKTISGLYYNDGTRNDVGLFGYVYGNGMVRNVTVKDSYFHGNNRVGGVAGYNTGSVKNSGSFAFVKGNVNVGGLNGYLYTGTLIDSYFAGTVMGAEYVGGVGGRVELDTLTNCFYLDTCGAAGYGTAKTEAQFASGEVAYLLQGDKTEQVWGQKLGEDPYPVLYGEKVYAIYNCLDEIISYSNVERASAEHSYEKGFCTVCGGYEAPKLNADGFYEIGNAGQLYWFAQKVNSGGNEINAILTDNIVVNENLMEKITIAEDGTATVNEGETIREWAPIGGSKYPYSGTFDGNGKTVTGLYRNVSANFVGLIGYLKGSGKVQNVTVADSYFCGNYVGGVVGYSCAGSTVSNCHNTGSVSGSDYVGGVAGYNGGSMTECCNAGTVSGEFDVGGVAGCNAVSTLSNCYNTGSVSGYYYVGGVVGSCDAGATVSNCYNTGSVSGRGSKGGVVGVNTGTVTNCFYLNTCGAAGEGTAKTEAQFASGEVAWLLNGSTDEGELVWKQNIGTDAIPGFEGEIVSYSSKTGAYYNKGNHEHQYEAVVTDPTCTEPGYTTYTCSVCGDSYVADETSALGHSYEAVVTDPTCTEPGYTTYTCSVCGDSYVADETSALGHSYEAVVTDPTCTEPGYTTYTCSVCGDSYVADETSALGHSYEAVVTDPTCTEPGYTTYTCSVCGDSYVVDETSALGHSYENGFCTVCGGYEAPELNADGFYEIGNAGQLYWFAAQVNNGANNINAILTDNIVVNENLMEKITIAEDGTATVNEGETIREWAPIGGFVYYYSGTFDGNGKTVAGLYRNVSAIFVGLIGYLEGSGKVQNVTVADSYFRGVNNVGGVVGYSCAGSTVSNCHNTGSVSGSDEVGGVVGHNGGSMTECCNAGTVSGRFYVGGVAGWNDVNTLSNCYNTGTVSGFYYVGGVVGWNDVSTLSNCYNTGSVSGTYNVGGVVGFCYDGGTVSNCYNTGTVSGSSNYVGGVVGYSSADSTVSNCYNTGSVSGTYNVGGVVGFCYDGGTVSNCYNTGSVSAGNNVGGVVGVNSGTVTNCFYLDTCGAEGEGTAKTEAQFASGEVAWLLNGSTDEGELVWKQNIGTDAIPGFEGEIVSYSTKTGAYYNKGNHEHQYEAVVTDPTCTEPGYTTCTCSVCGDSYVADETSALGHEWNGTSCTRCDATRSNPFVDVPEDSWFIHPVLWAVEKGITSGVDDTHFGPNAACTRAQVVTFLWAAEGKPEPVSTVNPFVDVKEGDWFFKAVLWAKENGITSGLDDTHFGPNETCTREQVVTFLWAANGRPESSVSVSFTDVQPGIWYYAPVAWAVENKITSGMGDGTFGVGSTCTRAQVVTFLYAAK